MEEIEANSFKVLIFPWLAHGHIFPYLELAKRILKRKKFHIYLCTTPINFSSIKNFIETNYLQNSIEIIELHLQPFPDLPPHYHTTKNLPSNLNFTLHKAFQTSKSSFSVIVNTLDPDLVIYDVFQPWASTISSSKGIPAVYFSVMGAATPSFALHHYIHRENSSFPFPELRLTQYERKSEDNLFEFFSSNIYPGDKDITFSNFRESCDFAMLKTSRGFEEKYIDYISSHCGKEIVSVGPLVSDPNRMDEDPVVHWLSKKDEYSTVYISFGSECFLSKQEIEEIAKGLELCDPRVNFIWVVRFPVLENTVDSIEKEEALLIHEGFRERMRERGMVVERWAPQANILANKSIGGFMSHCGWSSINESVYFGVPVIGMPMKYNMFIDAKMIVDVGACIEVSRDDDNLYRGEGIAEAINKVIVGKSGERLRLKARELSEKMRMEEGPALDEAAEKLWNLCSNKKLP